MKLYTEKQVKEAYKAGTKNIDSDGCFIDKIEDDIKAVINYLTPIELPTDEEIEKQFTIGTSPKTSYPHMIEGAKWMRDKILKNK